VPPRSEVRYSNDVLLSRAEMTFDWGGAKLDPVRDREVLGWMMNQFLYGEVTGIQVGHWIYAAPDLESARFLARQAMEEFQHVDNFVRILDMLGCEPQKPNAMVRFLATGMMSSSWAEHVSLEMAAGEGFVLLAFYAVIDTLDHDESLAILRRAVKQEERHVEFGETQTMKLIEGRPGLRRRLLGLNLVNLWAVRRLVAFMRKRMPADHPVLSRLPAFLEMAIGCHELRLRRMGLLDRPLAELGGFTRAARVVEAYAAKALGALVGVVRLLPLVPKPRRLTETYLDDPEVRRLLPADLARDERPQ